MTARRALRRLCAGLLAVSACAAHAGSTPAARITLAMRATLAGVLMTTSAPEFMVFRSSVAMSGRSAAKARS